MAEVLKTLRSSGGDYTLLSEWEAAEQTDLVSAGDTHVLECYNDWPGGLSNNVTIAGWTTNSFYNITIRAAANNGADGVPSNTLDEGFSLVVAIAFGECIEVLQGYTTIENISGRNDTNGGCGILLGSGADGSVIDRCIMSGGKAGSNTASACFKVGSSVNPEVTVRNCLAWDGRNGIIASTATTGLAVENCSAIDNELSGYSSSVNNVNGALSVTNLASYGNGSNDVVVTGSAVPSGGTNATGDGTMVGSDAITDLTTTDFVDYVGNDYTPSPGSKLGNSGADLSSLFTNDITDTVRGQWDRGAYLQPGGGGGTPISFTGTIPNLKGYIGTPYSLDISTAWSGDITPFSFTKISGTAWPTGITMDSSGLISGTPTTEQYRSNIQVRGTDDDSNTADSNLFDFEIDPAPAGLGGVWEGSTEIQDFKVGNTQINEVYAGAILVWTNSDRQYFEPFPITDSSTWVPNTVGTVGIQSQYLFFSYYGGSLADFRMADDNWIDSRSPLEQHIIAIDVNHMHPDVTTCDLYVQNEGISAQQLGSWNQTYNGQTVYFTFTPGAGYNPFRLFIRVNSSTSNCELGISNIIVDVQV